MFLKQSFVLLQIIDENGKECGRYIEGDIAVKVKPKRPVGLFTEYLVSTATSSLSLHHLILHYPERLAMLKP
jgi:hypothetical protein